MNILINVSTVKIGGGLSVAKNFLKGFSQTENNNILIIVAPRNVGYESFNGNYKIIFVPNYMLLWFFRPFLDYFFIKSVIKKNNITKVFSLGNLPTITKLKQAYLFDNPFSTTNQLSELKLSKKAIILHKLRTYLLRRRLKYVNKVFVQTNTEKKLFKKFNYKGEIKVIGNSFSIITNPEKSIYNFTNNKIKLLCFTRYYPHKNIEILIELAKLFKEKNCKYQIYITIEPSQHKNVKQILNKISEYKLSEVIINIGKVKSENIYNLYKNIDALILPTLLESFTSTYIDAMQYKKPIFTSDKDFANEICGNYAYYFNPDSVIDIFNTIKEAYEDKNLMRKKLDLREKILSKHKTWKELSSIYINNL